MFHAPQKLFMNLADSFYQFRLVFSQFVKIAKAIKISRKCLRIVYQNITMALVVKFACLALGAVGIANMYLAIFADVGVMILAVLNAIRCLFVKKL